MLVVCLASYTLPVTVQPLTFELSLVSSKVKCVVEKAYKQSGRGLSEQSDY